LDYTISKSFFSKIRLPKYAIRNSKLTFKLYNTKVKYDDRTIFFLKTMASELHNSKIILAF